MQLYVNVPWLYEFLSSTGERKRRTVRQTADLPKHISWLRYGDRSVRVRLLYRWRGWWPCRGLHKILTGRISKQYTRLHVHGSGRYSMSCDGQASRSPSTPRFCRAYLPHVLSNCPPLVPALVPESPCRLIATPKQTARPKKRYARAQRFWRLEIYLLPTACSASFDLLDLRR